MIGIKETETKELKYYTFLKPLIPKFLRPLIEKYQEFFGYFVFGVMTAIVEMGVTWLCDIFTSAKLFGFVDLSGVIAWLVAAIFAFFVNKLWVFEDNDWSAKTVAYQFVSLLAVRFISLLVKSVLLFCTEDWNRYLQVFVAEIPVAITNYIMSKLIVFKKK